MQIPEIGIGLIYFPGFEKAIESNSDLIDVIEIEPQTFWFRQKSGLDSFSYARETISYLRDLQKPVLFHGVGFPVGGTIKPDPIHNPCMKRMIGELSPKWLSEHLSFNAFQKDSVTYNTNFLLPPLQTEEGVLISVNSIEEYRSNFYLPFAFETGVNYLAPKKFEMEDGKFVCEVAERSDCNILLDVHNLMANELNGRQKFSSFVSQIPLQRVIQIHLAGGFYFRNFYLDAHSGLVEQRLFDLLTEIVPTLPNLKAITFEMLPEYLQNVSQNQIRKLLEEMTDIWETRGKLAKKQSNDRLRGPIGVNTVERPTGTEWETTLGMLAIGLELDEDTQLSNALHEDQGLNVIQELIEKFKGSNIVGSLRLSSRYIIIKHTFEKLLELLRAFWKCSQPKLFAVDNGIDFADYLLGSQQLINDSILIDLVRYEKASLLALLDGSSRVINLSFNPTEVIPFLENFQLPKEFGKGNYQITIEADQDFKDTIQSVLHT